MRHGNIALPRSSAFREMSYYAAICHIEHGGTELFEADVDQAYNATESQVIYPPRICHTLCQTMVQRKEYDQAD